MKKKIISIASTIALIAIGIVAKAGYQLPGATVYVTITTNTVIGLTNYIPVQFPGAYLALSGITNGATQCTNNIVETLQTNGVQYTIVSSYVFRASDWGLSGASIASPASWSTNFPPATISVPAYNFFNIQPQLGSNTFSAQTY